MNRRYSVVYTMWIAICAVLFLALSRAEDPARRSGLILNDDAGMIATRAVRARGGDYRAFEVVHIAYAARGEAGPEPRWIVLLDGVPHTALQKALVVELRASDGAVLRVRKPD